MVVIGNGSGKGDPFFLAEFLDGPGIFWTHIPFVDADGAITAVNSVPNPGHRPGFLPNFLADNGAQVIISGGMGGGAVDIFNERGVEVIVGVQGDATAAVESYLKGELVSTGSICHEHEHADECGEHH